MKADLSKARTVPLDQIPESCRLPIAAFAKCEGRAAGKPQGLSTVAIWKRINKGTLTCAVGPHGTVCDAREMSAAAHELWQHEALRGPTPTLDSDPHTEPYRGPQTSLFIKRPEILALGLPTLDQQQVVERRLDLVLKVIGETKNGAFAKYGYATKTVFLRAVAAENSLSERQLFRFMDAYKRNGVAGLVREKPGPKGTGPRDLELWMRAHLEANYRAHHSKRDCYRRLLEEISVRQNTERWRVGHLYPVPSFDQCARFLRGLKPISEIARERGIKGLKESSGYLDRSIDECAGDCWCIDEWKVDAHLYLDWRVPEVVRPYVLTMMDERSKCILAWKIVIELSSAAVLDLTEECVRMHGRPLRWYSDRGGHFRGKVGRHYRELPKGEVLGPAAGALGRLGVLHQGPREKNPRGNRVERLHGFYAQKAMETLAGSSCGSDERMAETLGVYARVEEHKKFCTRDVNIREETRLLSYRQFEAIFPKWVEEHNSTPSKANGLHGLAPIAAFKTFAPLSEELEARRVPEERLAIAFAEYFTRKISLGGVIEIGEDHGRVKLRYSAPDLAPHAGEERQCFRLRHNDSFIVVEPLLGSNGERLIADRRVPVGVGDDSALAAAIEGRKRLEKFLVERYAPQRDNSASLAPSSSEVGNQNDFVMVHGIPAACEPASELEPVYSNLSRRELYNAGRAQPAELEPVEAPAEEIKRLTFWRG